MDVNTFMSLEQSLKQQRGGNSPQARFMNPVCQPILGPWQDRESKLPSRRNTMDDVMHGEERRRLVDIGRVARMDSMESSDDDGETSSVPGWPTRTQTRNEDALISDFYVFMPYDNYREMSAYYAHFAGKKKLNDDSVVNSGKIYGQIDGRDVASLRAYAYSPDQSLHLRRTLDQLFYEHIDTEARDSGQVILRFQNEILKDAVGDSKILMVDQLWMWVLGESLVVTSFPTKWDQPENDPLNILENILSIVDRGNLDPVRSVYDLAMIISGRCYGAYDRHGFGGVGPQFLDMFEGWISAAMDDEVELFNFFKQDSARATEWFRNPNSLQEVKGQLKEVGKRLATQTQTPRTPSFKVIRMPFEYALAEVSFVGTF